MRTHLVQYLLGLGLAGASACAPNAFEVTISGQTTINGDMSTAGSPLTRIPAIGSFASIDFGNSEEFKHYGASKEGVQSIKVSELSVRVVNPGTQGFDFLDEMSFYASGGGGEETLVAEKRNIASLPLAPPNPILFLDVNQSAELRGFLGAPTISLTARGSGRVPPQNTTLQATATLRVVLKVL